MRQEVSTLMAGPGQRGDKTDSPEDDIRLLAKYDQVVKLRLLGLSYRRVSEITGYTTRHVGRIMQAERARQLENRPLAEEMGNIWSELEDIREALRPAITGEPVPEGAIVPEKEVVTSMLAVLDRQIRIVGALSPLRSGTAGSDRQAPPESAPDQVANDEVSEFARNVALRRQLADQSDEDETSSSMARGPVDEYVPSVDESVT